MKQLTALPDGSITQLPHYPPWSSGPTVYFVGWYMPLSKEHFVREVRIALATAGINHRAYSRHSFRIGMATMAVQAGLPAHLVKMLGRWTSDAYELYIHTLWEVLATVSPTIAQ